MLWCCFDQAYHFSHHLYLYLQMFCSCFYPVLSVFVLHGCMNQAYHFYPPSVLVFVFGLIFELVFLFVSICMCAAMLFRSSVAFLATKLPWWAWPVTKAWLTITTGEENQNTNKDRQNHFWKYVDQLCYFECWFNIARLVNIFSTEDYHRTTSLSEPKFG